MGPMYERSRDASQKPKYSGSLNREKLIYSSQDSHPECALRLPEQQLLHIHPTYLISGTPTHMHQPGVYRVQHLAKWKNMLREQKVRLQSNLPLATGSSGGKLFSDCFEVKTPIY